MYTKTYEIRVDAPIERVWRFHSTVETLKMLTPAEMQMQLITKNPVVREGAIHEVTIKKLGFRRRWKAKLSQVREPYGFTDVALVSPFKSWKHVHEFIPDEGGTIIRDTVTYQPPGWILAGLINKMFVDEQLDELFHYRHKTTRDFVEDHTARINEEVFEAEKVKSVDLY